MGQLRATRWLSNWALGESHTSFACPFSSGTYVSADRRSHLDPSSPLDVIGGCLVSVHIPINYNSASREWKLTFLSCRALRKTSHVLSSLAGLVPSTLSTPITYYALDLQERELARTLTELDASDVGERIRGKISTRGLCATYDGGLKFIHEGGLEGRADAGRASARLEEQYQLDKPTRDASPSSNSDTSSGRASDDTIETPPSTPGAHSPLHILFLGSSLGNFSRGDDVAFLQSLPLRPGSGDTLLLGLDHDNEPKDIEAAYDDPEGVTKAFIMNGLKGASQALGDDSLFIENKWAYVGRYNSRQRACASTLSVMILLNATIRLS